jgi:glycosyltransferase involved in cell wall biosynthesis
VNLLHICEDFITGGIESFLVDLCDALRPETKSTVAFLYGRNRFEDGDGAPKRGLPFQVIQIGMLRYSRLEPLGILKLARVIRKSEANLLHCHSYYSVLAALLARPLTGHIPIVYTVHATLKPGRQRSDFLIRLAARKADAVVSVSANSGRGIMAITGGQVNPVVVLNGIDLRRVKSQNKSDQAKRRRELGISPKALVLLNVAALTVNKDQASLIRSVALVKQHFPRVLLLIAGAGPERQNLERLISLLKLEGCVHLLGARNDVPSLMAVSDLFVLSSRSEGMAISLLEACLAGVPAVCTAVGGAHELVRAGLDVTLIPCGNVGSLGDEIVRVCTRGARRTDSHGDVNQQFSIHRTAAEYMDVYRQARPFEWQAELASPECL